MNMHTRKTVFASGFALAMAAGICTSALAQTAAPSTPSGASGPVTTNPGNTSPMGSPMDSNRPLTPGIGGTTGTSSDSTVDGMGTSNKGTSVTGEGSAMSSTRFGSFDANGDGRLSREEMRNDVSLSGSFDAMDANRDGYLSKEENASFRSRSVTKTPRP